MSRYPQKVVVIPHSRSVSEAVADIAYEFWLTRCFREGGSPEDALFYAVLEVEFGAAVQNGPMPRPIGRVPRRVVSIDQRGNPSELGRKESRQAKRPQWR